MLVNGILSVKHEGSEVVDEGARLRCYSSRAVLAGPDFVDRLCGVKQLVLADKRKCCQIRVGVRLNRHNDFSRLDHTESRPRGRFN